MLPVDLDVARLSRTIDPVAMGQRIRSARLAAGLTQDELADGVASAAYISRIEVGNRRPGTKLLTHVAQRLGTSVEALVVGTTQDPRLETELSLDYAELALKCGDHLTALTGIDEVLGSDASGLPTASAVRARMIRASALEVAGDYHGAISELEQLVAECPRDTRWIGLVMALSRCYRISGDLSRAIEVGTSAGEEIERQGLAGTEEAIRLTVTVAGAYCERGDLAYGLRLCERAVEEAERIGSGLARASAYWNASVSRSLQGDVPSAVMLAKKALVVFETDGDARALAMLQSTLANMQLLLQPPDLDAAESNVAKALTVMEWSDASAAEKARVRLVSAKVAFNRGRLEEALVTATDCLEVAEDAAPVLGAHACLVMGRVALVEGDHAIARERFERAAALLTAVGADRPAAQCWFELGALLQEVGEDQAAMDAYRRAAASTGLTIPDTSSVLV
jgi:transcriptional regulator with XRE-family HTH domain